MYIHYCPDGNTFCDSSLSPSWNNEQEYTPGSESEETGSVNSKNVSRHDDLYSTYNTCESSAMACVLSLLEDDIGLGEINMSDFSWSLWNNHNHILKTFSLPRCQHIQSKYETLNLLRCTDTIWYNFYVPVSANALFSFV